MNKTVTTDWIEDDRQRYIAKGIISNREPQFATASGVALSADELDRRGFRDAAAAKRARFDPNWMTYNGQYSRTMH